jgi:hypothetical protein
MQARSAEPDPSTRTSHDPNEPPNEPPALVLDVQRSPDAADCPDAAALASSINARHGRRAIVQADAATGGATPAGADSPARVHVVVQRTPEGYAATLQTSGHRGGYRKILHPEPTCAGLDDWLSLALTLVLDGLSDVHPEATPPATDGKNSSEAPASGGQETAASDRSRSAKGDLALGALVLAGVLQQTSPGLVFDLRHRWTSGWSVAIGGSWVVDGTSDFGSGTIDASILAARVRPCRSVIGDGTSIDLQWCAAWHLGTIRGAGAGYPNSTSAWPWWMAVGTGPAVDAPLLGRLGLRGELEILVPFRKQQFKVGNDVAYKTTPVGVTAAISVSASIW